MVAPRSEDIQPPLHWHSHLWRYLACLVIGAVVWAPVAEEQWSRRPGLFWLDIGLAVCCLALVWWRRRWPMTIAVLTVALSPFTSLGAGAVTLAMVSLATHRRWWQVICVGVLSLAMTWVYYDVQPVTDTDPAWLLTTFSVAFTAAILAWGMYIGSRRELVWTLRQRAETAEAERDLRVVQARTTERARIAREMHDVLAHRISQISMHAGALSYRDDLTADDMRESATVIQQKAHEALTDLREVLGVLRDEDGQHTRPQPTYDDVPALIEEARDTGSRIEYDDRLATAPPDSVGRTIYRIVQEGLTNARKHAPTALVRITIDGDPDDGVTVVMSNPVGFGPSHTPGAGLGLVGLSERAALRGGRLQHGVDAGTFVLRAWLPWAP